MHDHEPVPNPDLLHHHDLTSYLLQVDGNCSLSSSSSDSNESDQNMFSPDHNSTPVPDPSSDIESDIVIPALLSSPHPSSLSNSMQSRSDLDNYLPFDVSPNHGDMTSTHPNLPGAPLHVPSTPEPVSPQLSLPLNSPRNNQPESPPYNIPVITSSTSARVSLHPPRTPCRQTIRRDNRAVTALSLPNIMVTNHRSMFPKFGNLIDEIMENDMHLGLHSEVWENSDNLSHAQAIEKAFELHGIEYISTPRPNRRGGGVAVTLISSSPFVLTKLDIAPQFETKQLEVCWGLVKPKNPTGPIKTLIICAFYLPPYSKVKSALVQHISINYFSLKSQYPDSAFICGGDKNDLNQQLLLDIDPSFRQIVTKPTYKHAILDIIVTDIGQYYTEPIIRPAVQPDNPGLASPSDHRIAFAMPNTSSYKPVKRETKTTIVRPLPADAISRFGNWIQRESWEFVYDGSDSSDMVARFNFILNQKLDLFCPTRVMKTTNLDGKIRSMAVKQACRRKNREYNKNGNSPKYKELKKLVKAELKKATRNFLEKQVNLTTTANNNWLKHVKYIAARPGDHDSTTFSLPEHVESNLTALESSNKICEYFSAISQEYTPLNVPTLPERVRAKLQGDPCQHPYLSDHTVYEGLKKGKKTCSVPGDIPIKILEEFLPELTAPIAAIYREAVSTHTWPQSYKKEYHLPINKVPLPKTEDDLRNLGLTPFLSKRLELFLIRWIRPFIEPHLDIDQLGGLPGCSVNHYLVKMFDFIHQSLDKSSTSPTAVVCALVDFSKAFNRIDHNIIVTILSDLNIPTCALRLIISYLSNRKMCVRYKGATSDEQAIPGGGPQGGLLTVLLFNLQVNLAGTPCPILPPLPVPVPEPCLPLPGPLPPCHQKEKSNKKK